jgi:hypothetical protein
MPLKEATPSARTPCSSPLSIFTIVGDDCDRAAAPTRIAIASVANEPNTRRFIRARIPHPAFTVAMLGVLESPNQAARGYIGTV